MASNAFALTLESEAFNALKSDFNQVLRKTLMNMEKKESEQAELTIKLSIELVKDLAPDFEKSTSEHRVERDIVKPMFSHKVSSLMKIKDEKSGVFSGDYEMIWDEEKNSYIMRPINHSQVSLFDEEKSEAPRMLEAAKVYLPEGLTDNNKSITDVIEADYKEITEADADIAEDMNGYAYEEPDEG